MLVQNDVHMNPKRRVSSAESSSLRQAVGSVWFCLLPSVYKRPQRESSFSIGLKGMITSLVLVQNDVHMNNTPPKKQNKNKTKQNKTKPKKKPTKNKHKPNQPPPKKNKTKQNKTNTPPQKKRKKKNRRKEFLS